MKSHYLLGWLILVFTLSACSTYSPILKYNDKPEIRSCLALFDAVDEVVADHGLTNAGEARVPGFPFLRTNRLLSSYQPEFNNEQLHEWLYLMADLDRVARFSELRNLSVAAKKNIGLKGIKLSDQLDNCRRILVNQVVQQPSALVTALPEISVPDNYVTWQRVFGLYYLSSLPVTIGVKHLRDEIRKTYATHETELPIHGKLFHLVPHGPKPVLTHEQLAEIVRSSKNSALGIPTPNAADRKLLFDYYAPEMLLDVVEANDQIGRMYIDDKSLARVDVSQPTMYRHLSHTRFGEQTLLQLNYVMWFPARTLKVPFDILGGHLDGINWRVTLDQMGQPLIYDAVHNCGCYHLFFPTLQVEFIANKDPAWYTEPPMSPQSIGHLEANERLTIRIAQHTHFIDRVSVMTSQPADFTRSYQFAEYESLNSLPNGNRFQSLFGPDGIVPGTERAERFILWTMGVASPGAMRQWGHHAVAFLGKRHFDDARLFESVMLIK